MTNEVEYLIIKDKKREEIQYKENVSYMFYKEIWKFILYSLKYDYQFLSINFRINNKHDICFIDKNDGIKYQILGDGLSTSWNSYYEGSEHFYIDNLFNTAIDKELLFKLFDSDRINYKAYNNKFSIDVNIVLRQQEIKEIVDNILVKNKILTKNYRG